MLKINLIVGWGMVGQAVFEYLQSSDQPEPIVIFDEKLGPNTLPTPLVTCLDDLMGYLRRVKTAYMSPGISPYHPVVVALGRHNIVVKTDIDLFVEHGLKPKQQLIGVTGTNGKSTVSALIGNLLSSAGIKSVVTANFGSSVLSDQSKEVVVYVLELSSFQLYWSGDIALDVAVLTNIDQDHLDWHGDLLHYQQAKLKIFKQAKRAVVLDVDQHQLNQHLDLKIVKNLIKPSRVSMQGGTIFINDQLLIHFADTLFSRPCDQINVLLAIRALESFELGHHVLKKGLLSYKGLAYRASFLGNKQGVDWINDSKATNFHATLGCLAGLKNRPIVLLLGGDMKGQAVDILSRLQGYSIRCVVSFGKDGLVLSRYLEQYFVCQYAKRLVDAFSLAHQVAQTGDCVVLSPGCSSVDEFSSYVQRGRLFDTLIDALAS